jgi:DNA-binding Xre family transcriptional regulator
MSKILGEVRTLGVCYNKLFKLLIDKNMKKGDLCVSAIVSRSSLAKLRNGENVNTDLIVRICRTLQCEPGDIMELAQDDEYQLLEKTR